MMQRIGVLFQNGALFGSLTVGENVALPMREHRRLPEGAMQELVRMKLAQVDLSHAEHMYPSELSGGMKKRAGLARALALDPEVLFCDEPSAGLDPLTSAELDQLILTLRDRLAMTVVIVTHELASIEGIADSVIMVGQGKVIAEGAIAEVRSRGIAPVDDFFARRTHSGPRKDVSAAELFGLATDPLTGPESAPRGGV
jgi:phospholipid/cholesterol/gamma-HCH transport system ATP-binding protein